MTVLEVRKWTLILILHCEEWSTWDLSAALNLLSQSKQIRHIELLIWSHTGSATESKLIEGKTFPTIALQVIDSAPELAKHLKKSKTDLICYLELKTQQSLDIPPLDNISAFAKGGILAPWLPFTQLPFETAQEVSLEMNNWVASTHLIQIALSQLAQMDAWTIFKVAETLETANVPFNWYAFSGSASGRVFPSPAQTDQSVLAVIPHYRCERWLSRCLRSLITQTRPLDSIVVIDDGSEEPPVSIVKNFPQVTLLTSPSNVGPYRLIQQVIEDTDYDAYLFQDADDWSTCDRLAKLIQAAHEAGAQLVGTQELRVIEEQQKLVPVNYPLNVNTALKYKPGHPLLHPTSLVSRNLVMQLGGFATGLRFGGDTEFLLRVAFVARIINIPDYCYFRQKRKDSLTTSPDTGLQSPARIKLLQSIKNRALANMASIHAGKTPCLAPLATAPAVNLQHRLGPELCYLNTKLK
jgi:hypothetical protein